MSNLAVKYFFKCLKVLDSVMFSDRRHGLSASQEG